MAMSKKDYELLAEALASAQINRLENAPMVQVAVCIDAVLMELIDVLKTDNPRFNGDAFTEHYRNALTTLAKSKRLRVRAR